MVRSNPKPRIKAISLSARRRMIHAATKIMPRRKKSDKPVMEDAPTTTSFSHPPEGVSYRQRESERMSRVTVLTMSRRKSLDRDRRSRSSLGADMSELVRRYFSELTETEYVVWWSTTIFTNPVIRPPLYFDHHAD